MLDQVITKGPGIHKTYPFAGPRDFIIRQLNLISFRNLLSLKMLYLGNLLVCAFYRGLDTATTPISRHLGAIA